MLQCIFQKLFQDSKKNIFFFVHRTFFLWNRYMLPQDIVYYFFYSPYYQDTLFVVITCYFFFVTCYYELVLLFFPSIFLFSTGNTDNRYFHCIIFSLSSIMKLYKKIIYLKMKISYFIRCH